MNYDVIYYKLVLLIITLIFNNKFYKIYTTLLILKLNF